MKFIDYLNKKYPSGNFGLMALEAKVFRIRYPLQSGWLQKHRDDEITMLQIRELKALLQKKDKDINKRTIEFLNGFFTGGDHIELIKSTILATFPKVDSLIQENKKACFHCKFLQEEQSGEVQESVLALLRILDQKHIAELKRQLSPK